jgi:hypothetical protein
MTDQTKISAINWVDTLVKERGIEQARQIMTYNVTKNAHFRESNHWITMVWHRINQIEDSNTPTN